MRIGSTARELANNFAVWAWGKVIPTETTELENFMMRWLEQFRPIAVVTIPRYMRSYKASEKAAPKYYEKGGKKLPVPFCDKLLWKSQGILEPDGVKYKWKSFPVVRQKVKKMVDFLVYADTEERVISNPKKVGLPRYQNVNGQDIYNGNISKAARNNLIMKIKDQFRQFVMTCPGIKKYPLIMEVEVWDAPIDDTFSKKQDWDLGNRIFPYNKAFEDVLKKADCGIIEDDSIWYITGPPAPIFCPISNPDERKLVYKFYIDRRRLIIDNPHYQEVLKEKLQ
jgi:hypothetical protein